MAKTDENLLNEFIEYERKKNPEFDSIQLKWGWVVMAIGIGSVLACALIDRMNANR